MTNAPSLPPFDLAAYRGLLDRLRRAGYRFATVPELPRTVEVSVVASSVYLRHDVDFHPASTMQMAELEASLGLAATYYVALTQLYNPHHPRHASALRRLRHLGHEVGLHYDLETYPGESNAREARLDWEASVLGSIVDSQVRTIASHQPFKDLPDPFLISDRYVNAHDPRTAGRVTYISDSCRAGRDTSLLACFGERPPVHLLLNTHPELWLDGSIRNRIEYLDRVLIPGCGREMSDYFDTTVRQIWTTHPAPRMHDRREAAAGEHHTSPGA